MTNWRRTINIKPALHDYPDELREDEGAALVRYCKDYIVPLLTIEAAKASTTEEVVDGLALDEFANRLEEAETVYAFDRVLADLYDWADKREIWLGV
jgi:hypothetical protein